MGRNIAKRDLGTKNRGTPKKEGGKKTLTNYGVTSIND